MSGDERFLPQTHVLVIAFAGVSIVFGWHCRHFNRQEEAGE